MMAPRKPMASTTKYIRLAGLSSDPMTPTARLIQTRRNAAASAMPTANRYAVVPPLPRNQHIRETSAENEGSHDNEVEQRPVPVVGHLHPHERNHQNGHCSERDGHDRSVPVSDQQRAPLLERGGKQVRQGADPQGCQSYASAI